MQKNSQLRISLIIPTYNDEETILDQVNHCEKILKQYCDDYEIIIADDYSVDKTRQIIIDNFKKSKYRLILNKKNLGITNNMRQLYTKATKDFILLYSVDGDWKTTDVKHLIETQIKENADIVIGKRAKKTGYTIYRNIISFFHKLLPLIVFGVNTMDPGGIKIVRKELAQIKLISSSQFFEAEIIIRAKRSGHTITSYPVSYRKKYTGSGYGGSFSSAIESLYDVGKLRLFLFISS